MAACFSARSTASSFRFGGPLHDGAPGFHTRSAQFHANRGRNGTSGSLPPDTAWAAQVSEVRTDKTLLAMVSAGSQPSSPSVLALFRTDLLTQGGLRIKRQPCGLGTGSLG